MSQYTISHTNSTGDGTKAHNVPLSAATQMKRTLIIKFFSGKRMKKETYIQKRGSGRVYIICAGLLMDITTKYIKDHSGQSIVENKNNIHK